MHKVPVRREREFLASFTDKTGNIEYSHNLILHTEL